MTKKIVQYGYMKMDPENIDIGIIDELSEEEKCQSDELILMHGIEIRLSLWKNPRLSQHLIPIRQVRSPKLRNPSGTRTTCYDLNRNVTT